MGKASSALRNYRRARALTQEQLAGLLGITQQTYGKYESGELTPPKDRQALIATILGTAVSVLWPESEPVLS
jgi:transcriptional regulator with XRE-family HTH domain